MRQILKIHPNDNIIVALQDLNAGERVGLDGVSYLTAEAIPAKHKFAALDFAEGDPIIMYGVLVGRAGKPIPAGARINQENVSHAAGSYRIETGRTNWHRPDVTRFQNRTFNGYHRADGKVGTRNYWLVVPLVFCENRNIDVLRDALLEPLGYLSGRQFGVDMPQLIDLFLRGATEDDILQADVLQTSAERGRSRLFPQVDGIKFLTHEGGCGGTRSDSDSLCRLLAGYILNPNVAGATVLSLGCQYTQMQLLKEAIHAFDPGFSKPLYMLEQQKSKSEREFIGEAVKKTFAGLMKANCTERRPAPLNKLVLGLECGASDGFSGISANPALGHTSDMLVAMGGATILSEFPELHGAEQDLIHRCVRLDLAEKFANLMETYNNRAKAAGSGFDMNPSPGNVRDGLITDAMKSAGAAQKGGISPVRDVLDYTEQVVHPGLNLLCTPGHDVESTTALAGSGANLIVFTTGLGTPTGNPVTPTVKMASNTALARRMPDLIDFDAGGIISGEAGIESTGSDLLEYLIRVANGEHTCAERLGHDEFIPWKRGLSL
ncbi:MAG: altronate dehydratase [Saprospiraceae bacterium]|jgi:altronate hydrolase|nr:altronate dehydratase [Saprospiraceae bacterium]